MTNGPRPRAALSRLGSRYGPVLLAAALFGASMLVARSFAPASSDAPSTSAAPNSPAPGETTIPWSGPSLYGIFAGCNPACDLEVAVEGIGRRLTTTDRAVDESAPSLSPDRTRVVYRCAEPAVEPNGAASARPAGLGSLCLVGTIAPDDQAATFPPVTTLLAAPDIDYGAPAWSPDGSTIAFVARGADGRGRLGMLDVAAGAARDVTMDPIDVSNPAWSADGSRLAFGCGAGTESGASSTRFCMMPPGGGDVTALGEVGGECGVPTFMPDGVHLAVACVVPNAPGADLFMLSLDEPFTHSFTTSQRIAPEGVKRVVISPDQAYAFVRRDDALWAIRIPDGAWSLPPMPPLHGDFDVRVLE